MKSELVTVLVLALACAAPGAAQEGPAPQPTPPPTPAPASGQSGNYFNPSISLIGNFLGVGGTNKIENLPAASLRETELGFQAIVDPYARADVFISVGEENDINVEEGYITFTSLPWDLLVKVGRMRVPFGKINSLHMHVLPWADEPLNVVNLLGGDEGWIGSGVSVAKLIPLGDVFSELTVQAFRGDADGLFAAPERSDLAYNGHYRVFADLSDASNLDLGASFALGPNGTTTSASTKLGGLDVTYRWKPLQQGTYRSVILRGELFESEREQPGGTQKATGWFVSADYQLAKRWWVGLRGEGAEHADNASISDTGAAATLTFSPSEFSQLRLEARQRRYGGPNAVSDQTYTANEVLLQLQFAIGAHGAHPF
jgi:hypothetical protein